MSIDTIVYLCILIYSIIAHEVAHGYMAYIFGDNTAFHAGRLTMNPIPHIDLFGSIILPALSALSLGGAIVGWAKPVPYNPYNLKKQRLGEVLVAAAGVLMNIFLAIVFVLVYRALQGTVSPTVLSVLSMAVMINVSLAFFNLLPIPPFDGMRIVTSLFPVTGRKINRYVDSQGIVFMIVAIFVAFWLWGFVYPYVKDISVFLLG